MRRKPMRRVALSGSWRKFQRPVGTSLGDVAAIFHFASKKVNSPATAVRCGQCEVVSSSRTFLLLRLCQSKSSVNSQTSADRATAATQHEMKNSLARTPSTGGHPVKKGPASTEFTVFLKKSPRLPDTSDVRWALRAGGD